MRLRQRALRAGTDPGWAAEAGARACAALAGLSAFTAARTVGLYRPLPGEVPVDSLESRLRAGGRRILLPAWISETQAYAWAPWDETEPLVPGPYGVLQPPRASAGSRAPDLAVVPGLAFDGAGRRLGHGGGHFDRLLSAGPSVRIGLTFARHIVERIPVGPGDVPMDWIVTENGVRPAGDGNGIPVDPRPDPVPIPPFPRPPVL